MENDEISENGEPSNQERDGASIYSNQHGQYDGHSSSHAFRQLQPPSNNPGIFGSPEYWQYGSRSHHDIGGPMRSNAFPSSSANPSFFRSSTNQYGSYNERINQDFGGPINSFHPQFQSSANSQPIYGGTNNYYGRFDGRSSHGIGSPINSHGNQFHSPFNNASCFGGPNNQYGHNNRDNDSHSFHQFQTSNNRFMFGGPSDQHRGSHNYHVRDTHDAGQYMPLNNQTIDGAASFNNLSGQYDERNKNGTSDSVNTISSSQGVSHSTNANEQITDGSTRIEHAKLKIKIAEIYKEKALKPFTENSSRFDEDEWLKVWCIFSNGLRSYQCQMICPLCFKKVTPQNRSEPGSLPRWELTIVKGHLERIHATKPKRTAEASKHGDHVREDEEKNEEEGQKKNGKKTEIANEEEAQKIVEERHQKTSEEKAQEKQEEEIEKSVTAELDLVSEPESLIKTSSSSSESSSDVTELSSSDSDDTTVSTPERTTKRRKGTRKRQPSSKRGKVSSKSGNCL
ncbi:probable cyclin-dependent serine/threonine-protein kinase DDB_G0292550 [Bradysia coprophila]|uniref:probable cyclin-dependent serine/threonine-protein kinase DDB_G0292550 n=1 Tax=Bradysia coprophila TaxID=38358 RepID=UPI00187DC158|nr:probable cyclin-dependent serine/threonine-protein kinase DDB_G0292550 [Bradysia coprophila]